jgi:Zn finger protein HypA/HybF involved in hydrogenase expression
MACILLILLPGLPILFVCIGLFSGLLVALKNLEHLLVAGHKQPREQITLQDAAVKAPPAYKSYAFERGWLIETMVVEQLYENLRRFSYAWFDLADTLTDWTWMRNWHIAYWLWLIKSSCQLAGALQYALVVEFCGLYTSFCTIILLIWQGGALLCITSFTTNQILYTQIHHAALQCPACHKEMSRPVYICPTCQTEHPQLQPDIYGIFAHRCSGCGTKLPTLNIYGLNSLTRVCPHCHHILNSNIGHGTNIHIANIGDIAAGKTTHLINAIQELSTTYALQNAMSITFSDPRQKKDFKVLAQQIKSGDKPQPTQELVPAAYTLQMRALQTRTPYMLNLYDTSGLSFSSTANSNKQQYYRHIQAILFTIDPITLPRFPIRSRSKNERQISPPGELTIMQIYEHMLQQLETSRRINVKWRSSIPIAIVITKADAGTLQKEISIPVIQKVLTDNASIHTEAEAVRHLVRTFLIARGLEPFMRDIEAHFRYVEYFACSAHDETQSLPGSPLYTLHPLLWILKRCGSIKANRAY